MSFSKPLSRAIGSIHQSGHGGSINPATGGSTTYNLASGGGYLYNAQGASSTGAVNIVIDPSYLESSKLTASFGRKSMTIAWVNDDVRVELFELVDGQQVKALLEPETGLAPIEQLRISNLITLLQAGGENAKPISYLRKHNLERHFRFTTE